MSGLTVVGTTVCDLNNKASKSKINIFINLGDHVGGPSNLLILSQMN